MTSPEVIVSTLICHRDMETGLACLGSLAKHSAEPIRFDIHEDGTLTGEDMERLSGQLPVRRFISRKEADPQIEELLSRYPQCQSFRRRYVYGLKLFDAPLLGAGEDLAFCDTDIFFLRPFSHLFGWPDESTGCLFMQDYQNAYAFRPWHLLAEPRLALPPKLNCGLFRFRRRHYDLDFIEWLLGRYERLFTVRHHWVEQTCWGAMTAGINGRFWDVQQLCVVRGEACLTDELIGAHLVTPVRGLLPMAAARNPTGCAQVPVRSEPMPRLRASDLLVEQGGLFLRRKLGIAG